MKKYEKVGPPTAGNRAPALYVYAGCVCSEIRSALSRARGANEILHLFQ